jgi:hypothetical protein
MRWACPAVLISAEVLHPIARKCELVPMNHGLFFQGTQKFEQKHSPSRVVPARIETLHPHNGALGGRQFFDRETGLSHLGSQFVGWRKNVVREVLRIVRRVTMLAVTDFQRPSKSNNWPVSPPLSWHPSFSTTPHSHSIVLSHRNTHFSAQFFSAHGKEPTPNPSKIRALEFRGKFGRFGSSSVSVAIDVDRPIFLNSSSARGSRVAGKNAVAMKTSNG